MSNDTKKFLLQFHVKNIVGIIFRLVALGFLIYAIYKGIHTKIVLVYLSASVIGFEITRFINSRHQMLEKKLRSMLDEQN